MPRYELSDGRSNKFWQIELSGTSFTTTYGKIGTAGQKSIKTFATEAAAQREHDKLITEKTKKGYMLVGGRAATKAASKPTKTTTGADSAQYAKKIANLRKELASATDLKPLLSKFDRLNHGEAVKAIVKDLNKS